MNGHRQLKYIIKFALQRMKFIKPVQIMKILGNNHPWSWHLY